MQTDTDFLDAPIRVLRFERRLANCLLDQGIETVRDLVHATPSQLRCGRGFGAKSLREVQTVLELYGYELTEDPPTSIIIQSLTIAHGVEADWWPCCRPW